MTNIHPTAEVHPSVHVPATTKVWNYAQIREGVVLGENCVIGRNVYIGPGVVIGNNCKIQNNALIYEPAVLEDGVFIGPAVVLTNDKRPRAINPDGSIKSAADWDPVGVTIRTGASVGAASVCVAPVELGQWCAVGANSVVSKDVPAQEMVVGNPAKSVGPARY
jgi:UDP-2-acetamido-3-amino-2,3-dideoxy-glucuronate N-acetyltransferase